ncbi:MAG: hypothetical protein CMI16_06875 [Opitutaceae bacterium]|nr:hypothetical protein [Opitutaceae bacterium]
MDLGVSAAPSSLFGTLSASVFGSTGVQLRGIEPVATNPGLIQNATFSNASPSEFGMQTNKSIVYHCSAMLGDKTVAAERHAPVPYSPGAILLSWRSPRRFDFDTVGCPERARRVMDIMDVNRTLRENSEDFANNGIDTAEKLARELNFVGVLKTSVTDSARERSLGTSVVNNVVGQRASVVNVWGYDVTEGMRAYLVIKKKTMKTDGGTSVNAWYIAPHAGTTLSVDALTYVESSGKNAKMKVGHAIFVGTIMSAPTAHADGCANLLDDPARSSRLACYAGGVEVCLGV